MSFPIGYTSNPRAEEFLGGPVEITEARWYEMLEVLPPLKWRGGGGTQSFMMCEFTIDDITDIFCKIDGRYFSLSDRFTITHEEIVRRCLELVSNKLTGESE